jgi:drug/metabolite transporter (DMT)-like permease
VWAQAHVSLSTTSILLQGEPVGAAAAGVIFLDEPIGPVQVIGMAIATVALVILARHSAG